ncbi:MAG: hypothetical protein CMR00_11265 [[Chlorobium] sp. 445]|nr:MAG: hypothetical protein CMR00_11265 [[Chlorobium] sp. 445]
MHYCTSLALALLFASCNLFSARTPEPPETLAPLTQAWRPPTVADLVLENLSNAFATVNPVDYTRTFSPAPITDNLSVSDFVFVPAPETAGTAGAIFQNWNIISERRFFENFRSQLARDARPQLQIRVEERTLASATELQLSISYRLTARYTARDIPEQTSGKAVLRLLQSAQGFWYVREWRDFRADTDFTLSELKRRLAN